MGEADALHPAGAEHGVGRFEFLAALGEVDLDATIGFETLAVQGDQKVRLRPKQHAWGGLDVGHNEEDWTADRRRAGGQDVDWHAEALGRFYDVGRAAVEAVAKKQHPLGCGRCRAAAPSARG